MLKTKGFLPFHDKDLSERGTGFAHWAGYMLTMEFWGIDGIIFMCLMEFEDRLKIELDCFSSGQLCRKEKYIKARRQGKKRVQQLTSCLSTLWRNEDN